MTKFAKLSGQLKRQLDTLRKPKKLIKQLFRIDDSPHAIALGAAVGIFAAWVPTFGFKLISVFLVSGRLKANRVSSFAFVGLNNPLTVVPIYSLNFAVGNFLTGLFKNDSPANSRDISELFQITANLRNLFQTQFWLDFFDFSLRIGIDLMIGSVLTGSLMAVLGYVIVLKVVKMHKHQQSKAR